MKWWNLELKDRTPEWAEKETLIPAEQIVRVTRAMGKAAPKTAVWMGPGVAMNPRGTYAAMAVYALNGLLGSIDVEGGVWQSSSVPIAAFPKSDAYLDDVAKGAGKFKKLDGRGAKDMPAMMNARPGSGVVTNNIANGMLKDPGAAKVVHLLVGELQLLLHRRGALGQGDGRGAVLRAHGDQPVGDDAVRRHRAAVDVQLGRGLVDRHQHGQRLRLCVDPAGRGASGSGTSSRKRPR